MTGKKDNCSFAVSERGPKAIYFNTMIYIRFHGVSKQLTGNSNSSENRSKQGKTI